MSKAQSRVLKLLESRCGEWVSRFELMGLGIQEYRVRIHELRKLGYVIENRRSYAGKVRDSCYRLVGGGGRPVAGEKQSEGQAA